MHKPKRTAHRGQTEGNARRTTLISLDPYLCPPKHINV